MISRKLDDLERPLNWEELNPRLRPTVEESLYSMNQELQRIDGMLNSVLGELWRIRAKLEKLEDPG